jgi:hypothetical protein
MHRPAPLPPSTSKACDRDTCSLRQIGCQAHIRIEEDYLQSEGYFLVPCSHPSRTGERVQHTQLLNIASGRTASMLKIDQSQIPFRILQ